MTVYQWLWFFLAMLFFVVVLAAVLAAGVVTWRRRRASILPPETGWLTDELVDEIIRYGRLNSAYVPDDRLDLDEIAREEERFWSETWDEPEAHWE